MYIFKCIAVFIKIWYQILIVFSVVITILYLVVWVMMITYISTNGEYNMYAHSVLFSLYQSLKTFSTAVNVVLHTSACIAHHVV